MPSASSTRVAAESSDTVGFIVALLVRYPEISTILAHPAVGTLEVSFVVNQRMSASAQHAVRELIVEHIGSLSALNGDPYEVLEVLFESSGGMTFVHVTRDARTTTREELALLTSLVSERFGERLLRNPPPDEAAEDDPAAQDEFVEYALEALRDPAQQKSLMGFREEKRVLVYFLSARKTKKVKARPRS
jgi:hypothetical protein